MRCARYIVAALALTGLIAGCTGEAEEAAPVQTGTIAPGDLATIPSLDNAVGAREDVTFGGCSTDTGEAAVSAVVTNSADQARDYVIAVSWTTDTSDVLARAVGAVSEVAPGASAEVTITAQVPEGATTCAFNVQAAAVEGD